jgi:hypothetical protein
MNTYFRMGSAALLFCIVACGQSWGTELVMVVEKNRVVLAADSLVTDDPEHQSMRRCKIHQSGNATYFYAISGVTFDRQIGFDANDLFAKRRKDLHGAESLNAIGASFLPQLQKHLDLLKKQAPNRYNSIIQSGSLESLFAIDAFRNAKEGYVKDFNIVNGRVVSVPARTCLNNPVQRLKRCTMKSNEKGLAPVLMKNPVQDSDDIVLSIHKIMDAATSSRSNDVGPPISILAIESNGQPQWLEPGLCTNIQKPLLAKKPTKSTK